MIDEPHPTRPVPVEPHHLGVHAGFIDEYQPGRIKQAFGIVVLLQTNQCHKASPDPRNPS